ncbi:MAG TPA: ABC transporter substrate-binding protein [Actinomycetota bacterium]
MPAAAGGQAARPSGLPLPASPHPAARPRPGGTPRGSSSRTALALLAAALLLASCTGRGNPLNRDGARAQGPPPRKGGSLAIALVEPASLDPGRAATPEELLLAANLFDGLTTLDGQGTLRPAAAASWTADARQRRWQFRLRGDGRFADGTPVQAADFKFAWERLVDPRTGPRSRALTGLLAEVKGYGALAAGRATGLAGVTAPDAATLVVELDQPLADFPAVVAHPRLAPLPRALVARDPKGFAARPQGNGPFVLAAPRTPGRPVDLVRNPAWAGRPAWLDKVHVDLVPDQQTAWLEFQDGLVRFAPVPLDQAAAAAAVYGTSQDGRTRPGLLQGPELTTWSLAFDVHAEPFDDPDARRAVSLALDRRLIASALAGSWSPATGLVPDGVPGARPSAACPACGHDPARARSLAKAAGLDQFTLTVPDDPLDRRVAQLAANDLRAAGVHVRLDPVAADGYPARLRQPGLQAFALGWTADYPRQDAFLFRQFASSARDDLTGFKDAGVDRLLAQARATADAAARTRLYQQAEDAVLAQVPVTPVLWQRHAAALAPGLRGFDLTPQGLVDLAEVSLTN